MPCPVTTPLNYSGTTQPFQSHTTYSYLPLLGRLCELRHGFTANDATYIALAEAINAVLYTREQRPCKSHRARAKRFTS
jgi:predicted nucleic acid-binding protein